MDASHHVTGEASYMFGLIFSPPCHVGFPNGDFVMATQKAYVRLSDTPILTDVRLVP